MRLSEHFTLEELTRTEVRQFGNTPGAEGVIKLRVLCELVLEPVRFHFAAPVVVTSGYRSPPVNKAVGGNPKSQHPLCEAADFHVIGMDHFSVARWIAKNLEFDQLILEFVNEAGTAGWIHCSYVGYRKSRGEILVINRSGRKRITVEEIPVAHAA